MVLILHNILEQTVALKVYGVEKTTPALFFRCSVHLTAD